MLLGIIRDDEIGSIKQKNKIDQIPAVSFVFFLYNLVGYQYLSKFVP